MDAKIIGQRLKNLREAKGVSIYEVAKQCGVTAAAISFYEAGKRIPRDTVKLRLANYYKRSVSTIFYAQDAHKTIAKGE